MTTTDAQFKVVNDQLLAKRAALAKDAPKKLAESSLKIGSRSRGSAEKKPCKKCGELKFTLWHEDICKACWHKTWEASKRGDGIRSLLAAANIPKRHAKFDDAGKDARWTAAFVKLRGRLSSDFTIALLGPRSRGKTQLGVCLMKEACRREQSALYVKTLGFFLRLRATFDTPGDTEEKVIETFVRPGLLIVDEVGIRGETKWEDRMLTHMIDRRYDDLVGTILISNQTEEAFAEAAGESVAHRMKEDGGIVVCDWTDFREVPR